MKISYNWLKNYLSNIPGPEETAKILTSIGLEVESLEKFESVKGGMEGIVIGQILTCRKHPDADKLTLTTVDIGNGQILPIVCGAPNVAEGQKVAVATVGTTLHIGKESISLKKAKIRGEVSEGMICAEDELGLGDDHQGIMVLNENAEIGMPAREYFGVESDFVFEIGLTPNRIDSASHYGVARDLTAYMNQEIKVELIKPDVGTFKVENTQLNIEVRVENTEACPRYSGVTISGLKVTESPIWLKNRLKAIGLNPINNVVDITNYVLHETGQPLHAFDADKIVGKKVIIKTLPDGTAFKTLDEQDRKLSSEDLMICNEKEGMCIAGVFGGFDSGVTEKTHAIFLESACFNPVYIRKTAKRHLLNTDSSFRFERGSDPNNTLFAMKRAALLLKDIAGGIVSSEVIDIYPKPVADFRINLSYDYLFTLMGKVIDKQKVRNILLSLDIKIEKEEKKGLHLLVPPYRVDVHRPSDVVEEILRIYGYNNVEVGENLISTLSYLQKPDREKITNKVAEMLSANGFAEIMANSLTKLEYYSGHDHDIVRIFNPLSNDLNAMRKTLLFGGLEAIQYNRNRKNSDLKLYEFGNTYYIDLEETSEDPHKKYREEFHLGMLLTGRAERENWLVSDRNIDFYHLKAYVNMVLSKTGNAAEKLQKTELLDESFKYGIILHNKGKELVRMGSVSSALRQMFDIPVEVFYADFTWDNVIDTMKGYRTQYSPVSRYPEVRRDLSMVLEKNTSYEEIRNIAMKSERKLLKTMNIFDVYEGDKIEKGKKSYALSFILQDENQTLTDKQIDSVMQKLARSFEKELGAQIRS